MKDCTFKPKINTSRKQYKGINALDPSYDKVVSKYKNHKESEINDRFNRYE